MKIKILLTSFQTWLPHQKSNSSDDLLLAIQKLDYSHDADLFFLRNLPVNIELASLQVIKEINRLNPDLIICCGMAEKREKLTIESHAYCEDECLHTSIDLIQLTKKLMVTEISHDAGKFVCEGLYYRVLKHIQSQDIECHSIFVHVPLLENNHLGLILGDFQVIFLLFAFKFASLIQTDTNLKNN